MSLNLLIAKRDELANQLAAHDAMLADARKQERAESIAKIEALMAEHGLTAADLGSKSQAKRIAVQRAAKPAQPKGKTYLFADGKTYTIGQRGKPCAAYLAAKVCGNLDYFEVSQELVEA